MYAVDVFLDNRSSRYIKNIWKELKDRGIDSSLYDTDGLMPHITLATYDNIDENKFISKLKEFKQKMKVIDTRFDVLGVFNTTGAFFTSPMITEELLNMHKEFYEYFKEFDGSASAYYMPGRWNPHCSLALGLSKDKMKEVFNFIVDIYEPFEASLYGIALYKIEIENGKFTDSIRLF